MSEFASRLTAERLRLFMSQADLASAGKVTYEMQSSYGRGVASPSADYLQNIAAAGIDVLYVLTGEKQVQLSHEQSILVRAYEYADEAGRAALQAVALVAVRATGSKAPDIGASGGNVVSVGGDQTVDGGVNCNVGQRK